MTEGPVMPRMAFLFRMLGEFLLLGDDLARGVRERPGRGLDLRR